MTVTIMKIVNNRISKVGIISFTSRIAGECNFENKNLKLCIHIEI